MGWFTITSTMRSPAGTNVVFALSVDGIMEVDELADELAEHGVITGTRYRVRNHREGGGSLEDPRSIMLTREGIAAAIPFAVDERFTIEGDPAAVSRRRK